MLIEALLLVVRPATAFLWYIVRLLLLGVDDAQRSSITDWSRT
jgi:hypothetical protein